jgi:hypothetical protein
MALLWFDGFDTYVGQPVGVFNGWTLTGGASVARVGRSGIGSSAFSIDGGIMRLLSWC